MGAQAHTPHSREQATRLRTRTERRSIPHLCKRMLFWMSLEFFIGQGSCCRKYFLEQEPNDNSLDKAQEAVIPPVILFATIFI